MSVQVFDRDKLPIGACIAGPALVFERRSTAVIEPGWTGTLDSAGALVLRASRDTEPVRKAEPEIARVELFSNRLAAIADEMGQMLQRTALSTNVKERLDFSCAVLDAGGELVVNAPHIPVHLGALAGTRDALVVPRG